MSAHPNDVNGPIDFESLDANRESITQMDQPIYRVDLERLSLSLANPRRGYAPATVGEMAKSISFHGQLTPLAVTPAANSNLYEVIDGGLRLAALRSMRKPDAICTVHGAITASKQLEISLAFNEARTQLLPLEVGLAVRRYQTLRQQENHPVTDQEAGDSLGFHKTRVSRSLRVVDNLAPELHDLVGMGANRLAPTNACHLARLPDHAQQKKLAAENLAGKLPHRLLAEEVRRILAGQSPAGGPQSCEEYCVPPLATLEGVSDCSYMAELRSAVKRNHVMLMGPRGTGKTTAVRRLAQEMGKTLHAVTVHSTCRLRICVGFKD